MMFDQREGVKELTGLKNYQERQGRTYIDYFAAVSMCKPA
jgi:hypothetical protein